MTAQWGMSPSDSVYWNLQRGLICESEQRSVEGEMEAICERFYVQVADLIFFFRFRCPHPYIKIIARVTRIMMMIMMLVMIIITMITTTMMEMT